MTAQHPIHSRPRISVRFGLALACAMVLAGCSGADDGDTKSSEKTGPVDTMIDIGDRKLHLQCEGSGSPTVVLEAGLTGDHRTWDQVFPDVAARTRVCAYDRANVEPSESAPTPRTAEDAVADLHALLEAANEDAPYVLVGFSFGGLISQLYASTYPEDVDGLVLVESNHPDEVDQFEAKLTKAQIAEDREMADANPEGVDVFTSFEQVQKAARLPDLPLVVVTSGMPGDWPPGYDPAVFDKMRAQQQKGLVGLVSDGQQIIAHKSGHEVPASEPKVVVKGIETVLDAIRD